MLAPGAGCAVSGRGEELAQQYQIATADMVGLQWAGCGHQKVSQCRKYRIVAGPPARSRAQPQESGACLGCRLTVPDGAVGVECGLHAGVRGQPQRSSGGFDLLGLSRRHCREQRSLGWLVDAKAGLGSKVSEPAVVVQRAEAEARVVLPWACDRRRLIKQSAKPKHLNKSTTDVMVSKFEDSGHPVFRASSALDRGFLKMEGVKCTVHFRGDLLNADLLFRTINSTQALSRGFISTPMHAVCFQQLVGTLVRPQLTKHSRIHRNLQLFPCSLLVSLNSPSSGSTK